MTFLKQVGLFIGLGVGIFAGHMLVNSLIGGGSSNARRTSEADIVYYDPSTNSYSKTPFPQNQGAYNNQQPKPVHGLDLSGVKFSENKPEERRW